MPHGPGLAPLFPACWVILSRYVVENAPPWALQGDLDVGVETLTGGTRSHGDTPSGRVSLLGC